MRPKLECTLEKSRDDCLKAIKTGNADLTVLEGGSVMDASTEFNAVPIIAESYGAGSTNHSERPAVAVVQKSGSINKLGKRDISSPPRGIVVARSLLSEDLRGKKSCHSGHKGDFAGWAAPVHAFRRKGLLKSEDEMADFFSASCAPGAPVDSNLCKQCVGNLASNNDQLRAATKCKPNKEEAYRGGAGALA